jgi:hypothetical protein
VVQNLVGKETQYSRKKGEKFLYDGRLPKRNLDNGALDIYYVPSLRGLLRMEGRFVVELAKLNEESPGEFQDDESRQTEIRAREHSIQIIRKLIKKRRMIGPCVIVTPRACSPFLSIRTKK